MSEPMSSVEIEDVLSSIRRLVSEDLRPAPRPVVTKPADKLILTPALRVVAKPAPRPTALPRLHLGAGPVMHGVASSLERAVGSHQADWESEVGDPPLIVTDMEWTEAGWATPTARVVNFPPVAEQPTPPWAQVDPDLPEPVTARAEPGIEPDRQWADRIQAEVVADLTVGEDVDPEMSFDEAVLRELVRDLILKELQGHLGERITRNVRKLVRAEIARALAIHDVS